MSTLSFHPTYIRKSHDRRLFRLVMEGGAAFRDAYVQRYEGRESAAEFQLRKCTTPTRNYAKAAIQDLRNHLFCKLESTTRLGGSISYSEAMFGFNGGVDRNGRSMTAFIGEIVLDEILAMGRYGIYVDAPQVEGLTRVTETRPYVYGYRDEDIVNWEKVDGKFTRLLLRDRVVQRDDLGMQSGTEERLRFLRITDSGRVGITFLKNPDPNTGMAEMEQLGEETVLELTEIPFVMVDLGQSLLTDIAPTQVAITNLASRDVNYAIRSNYPFFTRQKNRPNRGGPSGSHLDDSTGKTSEDVLYGGDTHGITYYKDEDRPGFINPSPEPLNASIGLQQHLINDIRNQLNQAVQAIASRESAEKKTLDNQGLEAGMAFIGSVLATAETQIAHFWSIYEERTPSLRKTAIITYPVEWGTKGFGQKVDEAGSLNELMFKLPSTTLKREVAKQIVQTLLRGRVAKARLVEILNEIDNNDFTTSDPSIVEMAAREGLAGITTASTSLGYAVDEKEKAQADRAERIRLTQEAQTSPDTDVNAGARGIRDLSANPSQEANQEKRSLDVD